MDAIDRRLLDEFQRDFPLAPRPYALLAARLGLAEDEVIDRLTRLTATGHIGRVGAVFRPHRVGASTLAAMAVPPDRLAAVADLVGAYPEVNHNYGRDHRLNLWFVVTAPDADRVEAVIADIRQRTGLGVLNLPMEQDFRLDLGFPLWN
jgi:siroheme decarboxylase